MPIIELEKISPQTVIPGYRARFVHTEHMTLAYWDIDADAVMPTHTHPQEQVSTIFKGRFEFELDGERTTLEPGRVVAIAPGQPHGGRAVTACRVLDVFYPVREEYR